jgi:hypothetical protein
MNALHVSPMAALNCVESIQLLSHPSHVKHYPSNGFNSWNTHSTLIFFPIVNGLRKTKAYVFVFFNQEKRKKHSITPPFSRDHFIINLWLCLN